MRDISYYLMPLQKRIEAFLKGKNWVLNAFILCIVELFLLCPPALFFFTKANTGGLFGEMVIARRNYIFSPPNYGVDLSHESKTYFRIFIPMLCKILNIKIYQPIFIIQNIVGLFSIFMAIKLSYNISKDKITALYSALSFTVLYVGRSAFHDVSGWFDAFAYFFVLLAFFDMPSTLRVVVLSFAYFTDERSLLSAFVLLVFFLIDEDKKWGFNIFNKRVFSVIASLLLYFFLRFIISYCFHIRNIIPNEPLELKHLVHTLWVGLEGFWIPFAISIFINLARKKYFYLVLLLAIIVLFSTMVLNIGDQTRSIAYIFPLYFLVLKLISDQVIISDCRNLFFLCLLVTFLYPADFYINGFERQYNQPIYIKILKSLYPNSVY